MLITQKLLSYLNRVFDKDPDQFLALRLSYDGPMSWRVQNAVLTTTVLDGSGGPLEIDLADYTVASLADYLADQPGYSVLYVDGSEFSQLSARTLIDAGADIATSNGDHLYGYTNVLWAFFEAVGNELMHAKDQIAQMLRQMSTRTAADMWLDELGGYYGVPRLAGELDGSYGPRIVAEVLRPRENNVAIEAAIKSFTGQDTVVTDVLEWSGTFPLYDGAITHNGSEVHNSVASPIYNLFDVQYGYDLINGGSFSEFQQVLVDLIERLRAAGTHLRALSLIGSRLDDTYTSPPTDDASMEVGAVLADTFAGEASETLAALVRMDGLVDLAAAGWDDAAMDVSYSTTYNGLRLHNGITLYQSGETVGEVL